MIGMIKRILEIFFEDTNFFSQSRCRRENKAEFNKVNLFTDEMMQVKHRGGKIAFHKRL